MDRYTRWTDKDNRLYIVLVKRAAIKIKGEQIVYEPTTIELLDVHNEKVNEIKFADFEKYVRRGKLKQIMRPAPEVVDMSGLPLKTQ